MSPRPTALIGILLLAGCAQSPPDAPAQQPAEPPARQAPEPAPEPTAQMPAPAPPVDATPPAPVADDWTTVAWPAHRAQIDELMLRVADVPGDNDAVPLAEALIERAVGPRPLGDVTGNWQLRSIQIQDSFGHAYPWFDASIAPGEAGLLAFAKSTGSQRRSGLLYPGRDERALVFLGARTVNEEPPLAYSHVAGAGAPSDSDSVGRLVRIGPQELLMVLDADGRGFELYHLRR